MTRTPGPAGVTDVGARGSQMGGKSPSRPRAVLTPSDTEGPGSVGPSGVGTDCPLSTCEPSQLLHNLKRKKIPPTPSFEVRAS